MKSETTLKEVTTEHWQQHYLEAERWQSELTFYDHELRFFVNLVDKHFVDLVQDLETTDLNGLAMRIHASQKDNRTLKEDIVDHLKHLQRLVEYPLVDDRNKFEQAHERLKTDLTRYHEEMKETKIKVFTDIEELMRHAKAKKINQ